MDSGGGGSSSESLSQWILQLITTLLRSVLIMRRDYVYVNLELGPENGNIRHLGLLRNDSSLIEHN